MTATATLRDEVLKNIDLLADEAWDVCTFLYENPELGLEEFKASERLIAVLESHGFTVQRGLEDLSTAFIARRNGLKPRPAISFLAEYDALPNIGHACGHNLIAIVGTYAGIALGAVAERLPGTILVIGTPAEENLGGKIKMLAKGAFDHVDVAMMAHPSTETAVRAKALASQVTEVTFFGKPAHAAATPWRGINALDALIQTFVALDLLRKQMKPSIRTPGIITEGGERANIVPERATGVFSLRAETFPELEELLEKFKNIVQAAALSTGATFEIKYPEPAYLDMRNVEKLVVAFEKNWLELGGKLFVDKGKTPGSLDIGNISYKIPALHPSFAITTEPIAGHTREFCQATRTTMAREETFRMIKALALTGLDILTQPNLLKDIQNEFVRL